MKISVKGRTKLIATLEGYTSKTRLHLALDKAGTIVEAAAKENISRGMPDWKPLKPGTIKKKGSSKPLVDTGIMLNSITHKIEGDYCKVGAFGIAYAVYQEFGAPKANIPPRPFWRPALLESKKKINAVFQKAVKGRP